MDLNPIGKHCALQSCNVLDFLPIQCTCLRWFCNLHILPSLHDCSAVQQHLPPDSSSSTPARTKCAFSGCKKSSLAIGSTALDLTREVESGAAAPTGCPGCHLGFCVDHRHTESHSCTGLTVGKDNAKHETARAILAQNFSEAGTSSSQTPVVAPRQRSHPSNPQKLAQLQKVNLMKLRHRAIPADTKDKTSVLPVDQRLHVTMRLETDDDSPPTKEVVLWFRKTTIAGKALDLVAQHFGLSHTVSTLCLQQLSAEGGSRALLNHLELTRQIDDGSTVSLTCSRSDG